MMLHRSNTRTTSSTALTLYPSRDWSPPRSEPTAARASGCWQLHSMGKGWGPLGCTNIFCIEPDEVDTTYFYILVTVSFINCLVALATVYLV